MREHVTIRKRIIVARKIILIDTTSARLYRHLYHCLLDFYAVVRYSNSLKK